MSLLKTLLLSILLSTSANAAELKLCVFADKDVSLDNAQALVDSWNSKEGKEFDLPARITKFEHLKLNGISPIRLMQLPEAAYLTPECDRIVGLVGRKADHVILHTVGLLLVGPLPEVLGGALHSHMTVVAKMSTANQLLKSPSVAFRHEILHTLGCGHDTVFGKNCKRAVEDLKAAQINDFFPAVFPIQKDALKYTNGIYTLVNTREEINRVNHEILVELYNQHAARKAKRYKKK